LRDVRKKKQQPNGKTANRIIVAASVAVAPSSSMSKLLFFLPHNPPPPLGKTPPFPFFASSCECHLNVLRVDLHSLGSIQSLFCASKLN